MLPANLSETVIVFDLDDTLYHERDYQLSGIAHVASVVGRAAAKDVSSAVHEALGKGADLWDAACAAGGLPPGAKEQLLWLYRLHPPEIALTQGAREALEFARKAAKGIAILTDGRSVTQRLKLRALGLADIPAFISEETGWGKPDERAYSNVMAKLPATHYVYVADNPTKDFVSANTLGWTTFGLLPREGCIHPFEPDGVPQTHRPQAWISDLAELVSR
jgi:putative hydrolase of the HAD superfamily